MRNDHVNHVRSRELLEKVHLCGRCGTHLWSQKRSTSQKAKLFELSKPVTSIDEFWSHSWHGRQRWKVWCLLLLAHVCSKLLFQFAQFVFSALCSIRLAWKFVNY